MKGLIWRHPQKPVTFVLSVVLLCRLSLTQIPTVIGFSHLTEVMSNHLGVVRQSWSNHQAVIRHCQAITRQSSYSSQVIVRQLSVSCQALITKSSCIVKSVVRQLSKKFSGSCHKSYGSHQAVVKLFILSFIAQPTDYGHTKAKSLIICGPNSNPNSK